jgi:hypothetical protein
MYRTFSGRGGGASGTFSGTALVGSLTASPSSLTHRPCVLALWGSSSWPSVWVLCLPTGPQAGATCLDIDVAYLTLLGPYAHVHVPVWGVRAAVPRPSCLVCGGGCLRRGTAEAAEWSTFPSPHDFELGSWPYTQPQAHGMRGRPALGSALPSPVLTASS